MTTIRYEPAQKRTEDRRTVRQWCETFPCGTVMADPEDDLYLITDGSTIVRIAAFIGSRVGAVYFEDSYLTFARKVHLLTLTERISHE